MNPPTSTSRPPSGAPRSDGNTKYVLVAVGLLAAIGAVVAWLRFSNSATAPAPAPPPSLAAPIAPPPNPKLEDIPPPAPPEEKPEAGGPRIIYVQAGGCEGKCVGKAPPELGPALQARAGQARKCYNSALNQDSTLKGHVTIAVRVGSGGNVCSASVASNDMGSPSVANCAANIFRSSSFPSPQGGCVEATVPLSFVPQGQ